MAGTNRPCSEQPGRSRAFPRRAPATILAAALACSLALPAAGQSAPSTPTSLSITYTFLRDSEAEQDFSRGATVAVARRLHGWLAVAAELAVSTDSNDFSPTGGGVYDFRYESVHAGPRVARPGGAVRPFAELLLGATRWRIRETFLDRTGWEGVTNLSLQTGAGVDVFFTDHLALRVGGDLRLLFKHDNRFDEDYRTNLFRFHAGASVHF